MGKEAHLEILWRHLRDAVANLPAAQCRRGREIKAPGEIADALLGLSNDMLLDGLHSSQELLSLMIEHGGFVRSWRTPASRARNQARTVLICGYPSTSAGLQDEMEAQAGPSSAPGMPPRPHGATADRQHFERATASRVSPAHTCFYLHACRACC